jgi:N-acetylglucosamine-6-phosphate deacetylase
MDILNARLIGYQGLQHIHIDPQGWVQTIQPMANVPLETQSSSTALDVAGDWISPGGVDLQINGALGLAFPDLNLENYEKLTTICEFLWSQGVDGFLPTIVTTSVENIQRSLAAIAQFQESLSRENNRRSAQILGVHLEGPFLNPQKRGAHPEEHLLPLTINQVKRVLGDYAQIVKLVTLAPELDPTGDAIHYLRSLGITVSLGHSLASAAQAQQAFEQGASMVTHAFNAMPPLHHREPGLLGAAIVHPDVHCGFIADGQHVSPIMLDVLLRASHYEQGLFLVSDALAPLGLPDGIYPWDTRQIEVRQGTARLPDGTLSGTTLPLLTGVQNLVQWGICEIETAIALATVSPRRAIGLSTNLEKSVNLLRWQYQTPNHLTWERLNTSTVLQ